MYLFHTHTPIDNISLVVEGIWYAEKSIPKLICSYVAHNWFSQWSNDVTVWHNKIYLKDPILLAEDGPIKKVRRWFAQFYSTNHRLVQYDN